MKVDDDTDLRQTVGSERPPPSSIELALNTQTSFDRAQVAWLMAEASRWGREAGYQNGWVDGYITRGLEETQLAMDWAHQQRTFSGETVAASLEKRRRRDDWDASAAVPRPGDFRGLNQQVAA